MSSQAFPYVVPLRESVRFGPWLIRQQGEWVTASSEFEGWDPGSDVLLRREVSLDVEAVVGRTLIPAGASLAVVTSWVSSGVNMSGEAGRTAVSRHDSFLHEVRLPGSQVGGTVLLKTALLLADAVPFRPGVAHLPGSVFVSDQFRLALEGSAAMFPVAIVDFAHTSHDSDASWHLAASSDLEAPFMGRFQLKVNSRDRELVAAIGAEQPTERQVALIEEMRHQVAMLLLEYAQLCDLDGSVTGGEFYPDSVGDALARVLSSAGGERVTSPTGDHTVAERRSAREGATRRSGQGRSFR